MAHRGTSPKESNELYASDGDLSCALGVMESMLFSFLRQFASAVVEVGLKAT